MQTNNNQRPEKSLAIAICGESGAGKTTTTELLKNRGFSACSVSAYLRQEAESAIENPSRSQVQEYGRQRQLKEGADYFARRMLDELAPFEKPRTVIDGLRNLSELNTLRRAATDAGAQLVLIALVTPDETRFQRVKDRGRAGDPTSLEKFIADDERAKGLSNDEEAFQQNEALIETADEKITNTGGIEDLEGSIDSLLQKVTKV